ncbi:MAG: GNAT family N-acetyltransferase [Candidatus Micrarchaeota archaeon]|nr:GNAT family N-acetyltransferase [Candidatus Micrarchaeota archaeon]
MPLETEKPTDTSIFYTLKSSDRKIFIGFECENKDDEEFVKDDIFKYRDLQLGVTYLLKPSEKVLSFVTLATGSIDLKDLKLDLPVSERPTKMPAILIGRLATTKDQYRRGHGSKMIALAVKLALEMSEKIGARVLLVHARNDPKIIAFYVKNGFEPCYSQRVGRDVIPMYLDLLA